ncbi:MAG: ABC transporter permease [Planctomycetota bacterium]|nr:MAG: ABC transporter permease [Planctomycetota bacterium]
MSAVRPRDHSPQSHWLESGKAILRAPETGLFIAILLSIGIIAYLDSSLAFFSRYSRQTLYHQIALYGVLAIGAAVVIISGGIDLSIGSVAAFASVLSAKLVTSWLPGASTDTANPPSALTVLIAILITLLAGLLIGVLHAQVIDRIGLPPFITTLASMAGLRSISTLLSENRSINVSFNSFRWLGKEWQNSLIGFAIVAIIFSAILGLTVIGRHLYAMGGNETAARLSGVRIRRLRAFAYGTSAMLAALGGVMFTGKSGQGQSTLGVGYELWAITAAVVGGCSLAGGVGSIRGTVLGLCLIQIIIKGTGQVVREFEVSLPWIRLVSEAPWLNPGWRTFAFKGIDSTQIEGLILGLVVVLAVAFNQRLRVRRN